MAAHQLMEAGANGPKTTRLVLSPVGEGYSTELDHAPIHRESECKSSYFTAVDVIF